MADLVDWTSFDDKVLQRIGNDAHERLLECVAQASDLFGRPDKTRSEEISSNVKFLCNQIENLRQILRNRGVKPEF